MNESQHQQEQNPLQQITVEKPASSILPGAPSTPEDHRKQIIESIESLFNSELVKHKNEFTEGKLTLLRSSEPTDLLVCMINILFNFIKKDTKNDRDKLVLEEIKKSMLGLVRTLVVKKVDYDRDKVLTEYVGVISQAIKEIR